VGLANAPFFTVAILNRTPNSHVVLSNCGVKATLHVCFLPLLDSSIMCKIPQGTALAWDIIDVGWVRLDSMLSSRIGRKESVEKSLPESSSIFLTVGHLI
jgi:hypothetical protein